MSRSLAVTLGLALPLAAAHAQPAEAEQGRVAIVSEDGSDPMVARLKASLARLDLVAVVVVAPVADDLSVVAAQVRAGEGSLGKLVMDTELYQEALESVQLITRTLEDYREAAPISTFTNVLFGAF